MLEEYRRKRRFNVTPEPKGERVARKRGKKLAFVVQKHRATALHYDFRLEWKGVMLSWAVPKGPSYDPTVKRLAMQVEDHPLEYNRFEGIIPEGEYGGGTVMIWDRGTYGAEDGGDEDTIRSGYDRGDLKIVMHGTRMLGGWVLVRTRRDERGRAQWLLIKHRDAFASADLDVVADANTSIVTGRTMEEIARGAASKRSRRTRAKP